MNSHIMSGIQDTPVPIDTRPAAPAEIQQRQVHVHGRPFQPGQFGNPVEILAGAIGPTLALINGLRGQMGWAKKGNQVCLAHLIRDVPDWPTRIDRRTMDAAVYTRDWRNVFVIEHTPRRGLLSATGTVNCCVRVLPRVDTVSMVSFAHAIPSFGSMASSSKSRRGDRSIRRLQALTAKLDAKELFSEQTSDLFPRDVGPPTLEQTCTAAAAFLNKLPGGGGSTGLPARPRHRRGDGDGAG